MQIVVYSGFKKNPNSTKRPSGGATINVALKTPTSEMHPTFLITGFDLSWNYIQWGSSYYYVDDIVIVNNTMAEYQCSKDAMATFKDDITASSQLVSRNANTYQPYLCDMFYPALNDATMESALISTWDSPLNQTGTYVVGVVNEDAKNGVQFYTFGAGGNNFAQFMAFLFGSDWLDGNIQDIPISIQKELINPFQYIVSCMWFPLSIAGDLGLVKFGYWYTDIGGSGIRTGKLDESMRVVTMESTAELPRHPQASANGIYMNGAPFTQYMLDCWCFGQIPIDPQPFVGNNAIGLRIMVDVFTGAATLTVTNSSGKIVAKVSNQFGVPIQLSQITQGIVNPVASAVGGAVGYAGALVSPDPLGGIMGAGGKILSAVQSAFPQLQTSGAIGSKIAFAATPTITAKFFSTPTIAPAKAGRPLFEQRTLSGLTGFTMCENVDLETSASPEEKSQIIAYMQSGFFLE